MTLDRVLSGLGRFFIGAGILVFLFIAYQLWGTNLAEAQNQKRLQSQAASLFTEGGGTENPTTTTTAAPGASTPPTTEAAPAPTGEAVAVIRIPKINLTKAVVEGTSVADLKKGPGHYASTPLPGQPGNSAIAGHRTTYGAPFGDVGDLNVGDEIYVTTRQGEFTFVVSNKQVVDPSDVHVLDQTNDTRITLTTCHPKFSASQRLIISAVLKPGQQSAAPTPLGTDNTNSGGTLPGDESSSTVTTNPVNDPNVTTPAATAAADDLSLSGDPTAKAPAILWGIFAAGVFIAIYISGRVFRRWPAYLLGAPIFLLVLFVFFENFARLLPANA